MPQFTTRQPVPDVRINQQEWKPDSKVNIKHNDLHARARDCESESSIFDAKNNYAKPPKSPKSALQSVLLTEETWNTTKTARDRSRGTFSSKGGIM